MLPLPLVIRTIGDHEKTNTEFTLVLKERIQRLQDSDTQAGFRKKRQRFLPPDVVKRTVGSNRFWQYLCTVVTEEGLRVINQFKSGESDGAGFEM